MKRNWFIPNNVTHPLSPEQCWYYIVTGTQIRFVDNKKTIFSCFDLPYRHSDGEGGGGGGEGGKKDRIVYRPRCFISFCHDCSSGLVFGLSIK